MGTTERVMCQIYSSLMRPGSSSWHHISHLLAYLVLVTVAEFSPVILQL